MVEVVELKPGAEIRVYTDAGGEPVSGKFERASEESAIITTKSGQQSILRDDVVRIDCRRSRRGVRDTRVERKVARQGAEITSNTTPGATTTIKTKVALPAGFQTIYSRPAK